VSFARWCWQEEFLKRNNTYHYLSASLFFITVNSTETITSTKLAQQGTHENSFSQQNVDQKIPNKRGYVVRGCVFVTGLLILV
jgi:hypothetical protein